MVVIQLLLIGLLSFANASTYGCSNSELTDTLRDVFLKYHNDARRRVAKGMEPNKSGNLNPAKNLYKLSWNCEMERKVQDYIRTCPMTLGKFGGSTRIYSRSRFSNPGQIIKAAMDEWWGRVKQFGLNNKNKFAIPTAILNPFANMVSGKNTYVACTYKVCDSIGQIYCVYDNGGCSRHTILYETGQACINGNDCTTFRNSTCDDGLCVKPYEAADNVESNICTGTDGMTDKIRNKVLDTHNNLRSLVATGKAEDKLGGHAPTAARMQKMIYDCELENLAMEHAKKCLYKHSDETILKKHQMGENIFQVSIPNFDKVEAVEMASQLWFDELKLYGVGQANKFTLELAERPNKKIGHYTQMVWQESKLLGCAVKNCKVQTIVVCNYKKRGNLVNSFIYEIGEPCSKCPHGDPCKGTTEKLCLTG